MAVERRTSFTVRFSNPDTYRMLQLVADERKMSMNALVQEAVEELLNREATVVETRLNAALDVVRRYQSSELEKYAAAFARAEVTEEDPVRTTSTSSQEDYLGVRKAFTRPVEP